jgi:hypothetical protein
MEDKYMEKHYAKPLLEAGVTYFRPLDWEYVPHKYDVKMFVYVWRYKNRRGIEAIYTQNIENLQKLLDKWTCSGWTYFIPNHMQPD